MKVDWFTPSRLEARLALEAALEARFPRLIQRKPVVAGAPVDFYALLQAILQLGGLRRVESDGLWERVLELLGPEAIPITAKSGYRSRALAYLSWIEDEAPVARVKALMTAARAQAGGAQLSPTDPALRAPGCDGILLEAPVAQPWVDDARKIPLGRRLGERITPTEAVCFPALLHVMHPWMSPRLGLEASEGALLASMQAPPPATTSLLTPKPGAALDAADGGSAADASAQPAPAGALLAGAKRSREDADPGDEGPGEYAGSSAARTTGHFGGAMQDDGEAAPGEGGQLGASDPKRPRLQEGGSGGAAAGEAITKLDRAKQEALLAELLTRIQRYPGGFLTAEEAGISSWLVHPAFTRPLPPLQGWETDAERLYRIMDFEMQQWGAVATHFPPTAMTSDEEAVFPGYSPTLHSRISFLESARRDVVRHASQMLIMPSKMDPCPRVQRLPSSGMRLMWTAPAPAGAAPGGAAAPGTPNISLEEIMVSVSLRTPGGGWAMEDCSPAVLAAELLRAPVGSRPKVRPAAAFAVHRSCCVRSVLQSQGLPLDVEGEYPYSAVELKKRLSRFDAVLSRVMEASLPGNDEPWAGTGATATQLFLDVRNHILLKWVQSQDPSHPRNAWRPRPGARHGSKAEDGGAEGTGHFPSTHPAWGEEAAARYSGPGTAFLDPARKPLPRMLTFAEVVRTLPARYHELAAAVFEYLEARGKINIGATQLPAWMRAPSVPRTSLAAPVSMVPSPTPSSITSTSSTPLSAPAGPPGSAPGGSAAPAPPPALEAPWFEMPPLPGAGRRPMSAALTKRIIVVGAGISGLAAARTLAAFGHQVVVLEARSRPGGRICTNRDAMGVPVDEGAMISTGLEPNPFALLVRQCGLRPHVISNLQTPLLLPRRYHKRLVAMAKARMARAEAIKKWKEQQAEALVGGAKAALAKAAGSAPVAAAAGANPSAAPAEPRPAFPGYYPNGRQVLTVFLPAEVAHAPTQVVKHAIRVTTAHETLMLAHLQFLRRLLKVATAACQVMVHTPPAEAPDYVPPGAVKPGAPYPTYGVLHQGRKLPPVAEKMLADIMLEIQDTQAWLAFSLSERTTELLKYVLHRWYGVDPRAHESVMAAAKAAAAAADAAAAVPSNASGGAASGGATSGGGASSGAPSGGAARASAASHVAVAADTDDVGDDAPWVVSVPTFIDAEVETAFNQLLEEATLLRGLRTPPEPQLMASVYPLLGSHTSTVFSGRMPSDKMLARRCPDNRRVGQYGRRMGAIPLLKAPDGWLIAEQEVISQASHVSYAANYLAHALLALERDSSTGVRVMRGTRVPGLPLPPYVDCGHYARFLLDKLHDAAFQIASSGQTNGLTPTVAAAALFAEKVLPRLLNDGWPRVIPDRYVDPRRTDTEVSEAHDTVPPSQFAANTVLTIIRYLATAAVPQGGVQALLQPPVRLSTEPAAYPPYTFGSAGAVAPAPASGGGGAGAPPALVPSSSASPMPVKFGRNPTWDMSLGSAIEMAAVAREVRTAVTGGYSPETMARLRREEGELGGLAPPEPLQQPAAPHQASGPGSRGGKGARGGKCGSKGGATHASVAATNAAPALPNLSFLRLAAKDSDTDGLLLDKHSVAKVLADASLPATPQPVGFDDELEEIEPSTLTFAQLQRSLLRWHAANLEYGCAAGVAAVSLQSWDQDDAHNYHDRGEHNFIKDGYDGHVRGMIEGLPNVWYNTQVVRITHNVAPAAASPAAAGQPAATTPPVSVWMRPANPEPGEATTLRMLPADAVIITLPIGVLQAAAVEFTPQLPVWKLDAINAIGAGLLNKVILRFPRAFWRQGPGDVGGDISNILSSYGWGAAVPGSAGVKKADASALVSSGGSAAPPPVVVATAVATPITSTSSTPVNAITTAAVSFPAVTVVQQPTESDDEDEAKAQPAHKAAAAPAAAAAAAAPSTALVPASAAALAGPLPPPALVAARNMPAPSLSPTGAPYLPHYLARDTFLQRAPAWVRYLFAIAYPFYFGVLHNRNARAMRDAATRAGSAASEADGSGSANMTALVATGSAWVTQLGLGRPSTAVLANLGLQRDPSFAAIFNSFVTGVGPMRMVSFVPCLELLAGFNLQPSYFKDQDLFKAVALVLTARGRGDPVNTALPAINGSDGGNPSVYECLAAIREARGNMVLATHLIRCWRSGRLVWGSTRAAQTSAPATGPGAAPHPSALLSSSRVSRLVTPMQYPADVLQATIQDLQRSLPADILQALEASSSYAAGTFPVPAITPSPYFPPFGTPPSPAALAAAAAAAAKAAAAPPAAAALTKGAAPAAASAAPTPASTEEAPMFTLIETNDDAFGRVVLGDSPGAVLRRGEAYMFWCLDRIASGTAIRPKAPGKLALPAPTPAEEDKPPVLIAMMAGEAGEWVETASNEAVTKRVMGALRSLFGPSNVPEPEAAVITRWRSDPYARCSYSFLPTHSLGLHYDMLAAPVDDVLFFAGEATNRHHPTTAAGAFDSGVREAVRIAKMFGRSRDADCAKMLSSRAARLRNASISAPPDMHHHHAQAALQRPAAPPPAGAAAGGRPPQ